VDALLDKLLPNAQIVITRLFATRAFEHGLSRLQEWATESRGFLLCLPAVEAFDPDLMARSNIGVPLAQGLQCLSDHLLVTGWGFDPPQELPLHGIYEAELQSCKVAELQSGLPLVNQKSKIKNPTVGVLFYRSHLLSGNIDFVDAMIAEIEQRGL